MVRRVQAVSFRRQGKTHDLPFSSADIDQPRYCCALRVCTGCHRWRHHAATAIDLGKQRPQHRHTDAPLLRTPATVSVAPAQRDALRTSLSASRAFPQVTRDFKDFLDAQAQLSYATRGAATKVSDPTAFAEMQRYLFNRYNGLTVLRSVQQDGKVFDCIPIAQQPALRDGSTPAAPPSLSSNTGTVTPDRCGATLRYRQRTARTHRPGRDEQACGSAQLSAWHHSARSHPGRRMPHRPRLR